MSKEKRGEKRMKEEDILLKKLGKENSFKVPEGYFENLTSEVMNKLPEKEKVTLYNLVHRRIRENHRRLERFSFLKIHHGV